MPDCRQSLGTVCLRPGGFDRFQVALTIDGIRVYLLADNRLDFGRFLTPDLCEIQVQKDYAPC